MGGAAYGSLGYDGFHDWPLLQDRYTLAVLFEYAATLGLIGIEYVPPVGAREDYRDNWGGDDLDQLSCYDGPLALCLNPLGAYATGRAPACIPAPDPVDTDCPGIKGLPNFGIVALHGLRPADALLLDTFADKTSDRVWTPSAVDTKRTLKELRCCLAQASSQPLPRTVTTYIRDTETHMAPPWVRLQTAHAAAGLLADTAPGRAADLMETAVRLLPQVAPRRLGRADRQQALRGLTSLPHDAAALAVPEPERAMRALRLLEAGRAVPLSQALETRDDLSDLRRSHPSRAPRRSWSRPVAHP
ncbi:hypothetical protein [Streptomyces olivochromogenes]|uniref:Uncharacterized protein n=1 Tax=Streptomyces olivochromogenes TaxID=1963 RepID=A0A250VCF0_STROL|nr:hypothetical protein [Streptomyces olivochromogenes]KUN45331.1 hypothetical protein AQJ27_20470 [Streptomyces olivochromogenes]GAX51752.1 hypothetical protein SO3561_03259 [Streptomyces olivochromogenes]